jgi:hypothetical protein
MNVNTELNALSLNILFDGYVQLLEIQRVKEDHFHGRKNSVFSYFMCTCSDRLNTEFYFFILYNSLLLPYHTYAMQTHTYG